MYWRRPSDAELKQIGLKAKHYPEPEVTVWGDNWEATQLFRRLSTQWRVSASGPVGLDYTIFYRELDRAGIAGPEFDELMWQIGVIEAEALDCLYEK